YWSPSSLEPVPESFSWFYKEWGPPAELGEDKGKDDCPQRPAAAAAAASGATTAGGLGFWQLLGAGVASLGALGAALGIGQSLTTAAVSKSASTSDSTMTIKMDEELRTTLASGITVHLDDEMKGRLTGILVNLQMLIGKFGGGESNSQVAVLLKVIRDQLSVVIATGDRDLLRKLILEVQGLRNDERLQSSQLRVQLVNLENRLETELIKLRSTVDAASPRRNARSGL
ncbi:MAG TPA: hypothetical protein VNT42_10505, partial [Sphingomonas sp.]|nr:hypothetical protein [Sphingomonas sp.]